MQASFHMLLNLRERKIECSILVFSSQYIRERFIRLECQILNVRLRAAESLTNTTLFRESLRISNHTGFTEKTDGYAENEISGSYI